MYDFPMTVWLTVGWLLVAVGAVTLLVLLLRLLWYSWGEIGVGRSVRGAVVAAVPVRSDSRDGVAKRVS